MTGHGRPLAACATALLCCFTIGLCNPTGLDSQMIEWSVPSHWHDDAELTDVFFVDLDHGWVVGDRGLVLRTTDGGDNWETVNLKVGCRFESVTFADQQTGWIAGGFQFPGAASSRGVIFKTVDGGASWRRVEGLSIPKLNSLRFDDPRHGWALGDSSATHLGGIFTTNDGGATWSAPARGGLQSWLTGDRHGEQFVLTSALGQPAVKAKNQDLQSGYFPESPPTSIRLMQMQDAQHGLAVGSGAVLTTKNGGLSWHPWAAVGDQMREFDIHTFSRWEHRYWFAGCPGSYLFRFDEQNGTIAKRAMPTQSAVRKLLFQSDLIGWAITANGQILKSEDAGDSWSVQRQGGQRLGLMQIVLQPNQINLELFAKYCGSENHRGGTVWLDPASAHRELGWRPSVSLDTARQATLRVGASFVEYCKPYQGATGESIEALNELLVKKLRRHRPHTVVIPDIAPLANGMDLQAVVLSAVRDAADSQAHTTQISNLGLSPWQVRRVAHHRPGTAGEFKISANEYLPGIGCLVSDFVKPSRLLLSQNLTHPPVSCLSTIFVSPLAANSSTLIPSSEQTTRTGSTRAAGNLPLMRLLAGKSTAMRQLGEVNLEPGQNPSVIIQRIVETVAQLDEATAGVWMFELADHFHRKGHSELAAQIHGHMARTLRNHPLAFASLRWMYQYYASDEMALIFGQSLQAAQQIPASVKQPALQPRTRPVTTVKNGVVTTEWQVVDSKDQTDVSDPRQSQNQRLLPVVWNEEKILAVTRRRFMQANVVPQSLALIDYSAPQSAGMLLSRSLLNGKIDSTTPLDQQLKTIAIQTNFPLESTRARREMRIRKLAPGDIENHLQSAFSNSRPVLDGKFDEPPWQSPSLSNSTARMADEDVSVSFAHDQQFLYVAIRCRKRPGTSYSKTADPRRADDDLSRDDRIEMTIDTDRDPNVCFLLTIDSDGRVADSCGGNSAWNPTWYVASRQEDEHWFAEAAIELDQLRIEPENQVWTINLARWAGNRQLAMWPEQSGTAAQKEPASNLVAKNDTSDVEPQSLYISTISRNHINATSARLKFGVLEISEIQQASDPIVQDPDKAIPKRAPGKGFPKIRSLPKR